MFKKRRKQTWAGWQPCDEGARIESNPKKEVAQPKEDVQKENLETIQKSIEHAAKDIVHTTKLERDTAAKRMPSKVVAREEAAARSSRPVERQVLRKQAPKSRAEHLVKCSFVHGKKR